MEELQYNMERDLNEAYLEFSDPEDIEFLEVRIRQIKFSY